MRLFLTGIAVLRHDLIGALRAKSDWVNGWLFFILMVSLFPLAIAPDNALLHTIAPGLIWVAALFSMLLALSHFLRPDYEDGSLSALLLSPHPLSLLIGAKMFGHWLMSGVPLILITPLLGLALHLSGVEIVSLMATLVLGTPILTCIGAIGVALTVSLGNNNILLSLLVLPLCIPVLVFGAGAVVDVGRGMPVNGVFALLGAFLMLAITVTPWVVSAALRIGENG